VSYVVFTSAPEEQGAYPMPWTVGHRVFTPGVEDAHGNPVKAWAAPVDRGVYAWAPAGTSEPEAGRDEVTWDLDLYGPAGFTAGSLDRFVVDGDEFEVEGRVRDFNHGPFGFMPGVVVRLRRVEG